MKSDKIKSILIENSLLFAGISYFSIPFTRVIHSIQNFDISKLNEALNLTLGAIKSSPLIIPNTAELETIGFIGLVMLFFTLHRLSNIKNYMKDKAYGSSRWANNREMKELSGKKNILLSKNIKLNIDTRKTKLNDNVLVLGSSGSGKTRFFIKPQILESCKNEVFKGLIITDPKKELVIETGKLLKESGYDVKVLDLKDWEGNVWNPFNYFYTDEDVLSFVKSLIKNTNGENTNGDKFWENASILLFNAVFFYLIEKCPIEDRNLVNVKKLINLCSVKEEDEEHISNLDLMFKHLENENPNSKALSFYKSFKQASGKTLKSIIISCLANLNFIGLEKIDRTLSGKDEFDLENIGYNKTAVFITMSDVDNTYNFLGGMFIDQMLNAMIKKRDRERNKPPVMILADEFAQLGTLNNFAERISVIRSRNIAITIILQSIQQLKANYKGKDEIIIENCNSKVVLSTSESAKWVSEKLGKQTIDNQTHSRSYGKGKSSSTNDSQMARNLLDANEVEQLDNSKEIIMIKGKFPMLDDKYDITKHKLYKKLGDVNDDDNKNNYYLVEPVKENKSSLDKFIKEQLEIENKNIMQDILNDLRADNVEFDGNVDEALEELTDELMNDLNEIVE